jgi:hypothetical protein
VVRGSGIGSVSGRETDFTRSGIPLDAVYDRLAEPAHDC